MIWQMQVKPVQGIRARARAALSDEIKQAAKRQIAETGAAGISLRAIARELGMVSSALYRYYASRDELLTALIVDAYSDVAAAAEQAVHEPLEFVARWVAMACGIRDWARAHPYDYALIYGSPVPGYRAPAETIPAAARVALVPLSLLEEASRSGQIRAEPADRLPRVLQSDLSALGTELGLSAPHDVLARGLAAWSQLLGSISLELFGHLHNVINDYDTYFVFQMTEAARRLAIPY
jgi:AcrR family transcriptional regulator